MNLIFHQFKTDVRHFRWWLVMLWLSFVIGAVLMCAGSLRFDGAIMLQMLVLVWQIVIGGMLVAALVQSDPLVGTDAAWLTRPVRRQHLFWAKSAFMALLVLLPRIAAQSVAWILHGYSFHLWLCAAGQSLFYSGALVVGLAVLSSVTRNLAQFFLALGIAFAAFLASTVTVEMLKRAGMIHQPVPRPLERPSFENSAFTMAYLSVVAGSLAAWVAQARLRRVRTGIVCLAAGLMASPFIDTIWRHNFLKPLPTPAPSLTVSLWTKNSHTNAPPGARLASELVAYGVPQGDVPVMQDLRAFITFDGAGKSSKQSIGRIEDLTRRLPGNSSGEGIYYGVMQKDFPPETLWFNDNVFYGNWLAFAERDKEFERLPPRGTLDGSLDLDLFAVKKVAEVPLRPATFNTLPGQWVTIQRARLSGGFIVVSIKESAACLMWNRDLKTTAFYPTGANQKGICTFVLYDPVAGEATVVQPETFEADFPGGALNSQNTAFFQLRFPYSALRERLLGVTAAEWMRKARLCVFAPEYQGTGHYSFHQEHYQWTPPHLY